MIGQLGGWPILEGIKWEEKKFSWQGFDGKFQKSKIINNPNQKEIGCEKQ